MIARVLLVLGSVVAALVSIQGTSGSPSEFRAFGAYGSSPSGAPLSQDPEPERIECKDCKHHGLLPCSEHDRDTCASESRVRYCSVIHECEECQGAGWVDCEDCENPDQEAWLEAKLARIPREHAAQAKIDEEMEWPTRKLVSDHFVLVWEAPGMKVGRKRLDEHETMHLYADRLEEIHATYKEVFGVGDGVFGVKTRVFIWAMLPMHRRASLIFCGTQADNGVKLMGPEPNYSVHASRQLFPRDEILHRSIVHNVTHLLFAQHNPSRWVGNIQGGWADAGLAHWFEDRMLGGCTTYCYEEVATNRNFKNGKFRVGLRKMIAKGDQPSVAAVMQRNTANLLPEEHAVAFGFVDYLIHVDPEKFKRVGQRLRQKVEGRKALSDIYGQTVIQLEAAFHAHVLETYPTR